MILRLLEHQTHCPLAITKPGAGVACPTALAGCLNSGAALADQRAHRCYHLEPDMYKRERPGYPMVGEWPLDDEIVALRLFGTDQIYELAPGRRGADRRQQSNV